MSSSDDEKSDRTVYKEMDVEGNLIVETWRFLDKTKIMLYDIDKCVGCSLCFVVCPDRAIELGPVPDIAQGIIEDTPAVLIDTDKCSFCFMCEQVCINSVYSIKDGFGNEIDKSEFPKLKQLWKYDEGTCKLDTNNEYCQICSKIRDPENIRKGKHFAKDLKQVVDNCPTKSIVFDSPFEGTITIFKNQLHKCDPNGCKACVNICPTGSFFIPQTAEDILKYGKIACNEDTCIHCGACENSCPERLILVKRDKVAIEIPKEACHKPWINRWRQQLSDLTLSRDDLMEKIEREKEKILVTEEKEEQNGDFEQISPSVPFSHDEYIKERERNNIILKNIEDNLNKSNVRYFIQKKRTDKLKNYLKKYLHSKDSA